MEYEICWCDLEGMSGEETVRAQSPYDALRLAFPNGAQTMVPHPKGLLAIVIVEAEAYSVKVTLVP